ncbi:MAG: YdcF family protein [Reinekea sp.]
MVEIISILLIGFYSVGQWLVYPLESYSHLPEETAPSPDGIIVLGGAWRPFVADYWNQWELNQAAERELAFISLSRRYPDAKLVFTGGSGRLMHQDLKEADIAERLYKDLGIESGRVLFERESRNTFENVKFSRKLASPKAGERWWLITSAYHMPRSVGIFCRFGWPVIPYPVDHFYTEQTWKPSWGFTDHLWELEKVSYEWFGLLVYRITGKVTVFFPEEC